MGNSSRLNDFGQATQAAATRSALFISNSVRAQCSVCPNTGMAASVPFFFVFFFTLMLMHVFPIYTYIKECVQPASGKRGCACVRYACVRVCMRACVRVCVSECMRACVRECARAHVCVCVPARACVRA